MMIRTCNGDTTLLEYGLKVLKELEAEEMAKSQPNIYNGRRIRPSVSRKKKLNRTKVLKIDAGRMF